MGNRFYLIALPWLVLQLTGQAVTLGIIVVLSGIPRIAFMLIGGVLSDRLSARTLMFGANLARAILLAGLAWLVLAGKIELWILCIFSPGYGLVEAFFFPARSAIAPMLVQRSDLQAANSITLGVEQFSGLAGPLLAGLVIAWFDKASGRYGIGAALVISALATLVSIVALWRITPHTSQSASRSSKPTTSMTSSIKQLIEHVWQNPTLRTLLFTIGALNLLTVGPLAVGLPALANARLAEGAAALGLLTSALGGGALLGTASAGVLPQPAAQRIGAIAALAIGVCLAGLVMLGSATSTFIGALAALGMGVSIGYVNVITVTWIQSHTPQSLMGRVMSLTALK
jgi:predicted MFS family arabinose efflux permease